MKPPGPFTVPSPTKEAKPKRHWARVKNYRLYIACTGEPADRLPKNTWSDHRDSARCEFCIEAVGEFRIENEMAKAAAAEKTAEERRREFEEKFRFNLLPF